MKEFDLLVANDRWREAVLLGKCFFEGNTAFASRTAKHTEINLFAAADDVKDCEGYARPFILPNGMSSLFFFFLTVSSALPLSSTKSQPEELIAARKCLKELSARWPGEEMTYPLLPFFWRAIRFYLTYSHP